MSFVAFLGGKRVCLGKTFAESASKVLAPFMLYNFDLEFVEEKHMTYKPPNNLAMLHAPKVLVRSKKPAHL